VKSQGAKIESTMTNPTTYSTALDSSHEGACIPGVIAGPEKKVVTVRGKEDGY
jgi:hypothetical protein